MIREFGVRRRFVMRLNGRSSTLRRRDLCSASVIFYAACEHRFNIRVEDHQGG